MYRFLTACLSLVVGLLLSGATLALEHDPELSRYNKQKTEAIEAIRTFADQICTVGGFSQSTVEEELNGLEDSLSTIKLKLTKKFSRDEYVGVLQDRLTGKALDPPTCRQEVMAEWRSVFLPPPPPPLYSVQIKASGTFIDNTGFGPIDGSISSLKLYIDDDLVTDEYLDKKFRGHARLREGTHKFVFEADVMGAAGSLAMLDDSCEGAIDVSSDSVFAPQVVFILSGGDGVFTACDLVEQ